MSKYCERTQPQKVREYKYKYIRKCRRNKQCIYILLYRYFSITLVYLYFCFLPALVTYSSLFSLMNP